MKMKHIKLFESFFLSEAGTGYLSWKTHGDINDLADTLLKKQKFEKSTEDVLSGFNLPVDFKIQTPFLLRNVVDFNKFMSVFTLIGEPPREILDLSNPTDLDTFRSLQNARPGFYVIRNSHKMSREDDNIIQKNKSAIFIMVEESPLSRSELKAAIDYAKAGSLVMLGSDPNFFILI